MTDTIADYTTPDGIRASVPTEWRTHTDEHGDVFITDPKSNTTWREKRVCGSVWYESTEEGK